MTAGDPLAPGPDQDASASSPAPPASVAPTAPPLRSQLGLGLALRAFPALLVVGPLNLLLSVPALLLCLSGCGRADRTTCPWSAPSWPPFATLIGLGLLALAVVFVKVLGEASRHWPRG